MGLSPLPTAVVQNNKEHQTSAFPYPKIDRNLKPEARQGTPALAPLLPQTQNNAQQREAPAEDGGRMRELEKMLSEAQNRASVIEQEAYDKAYAAGEKSGLSLGEKRAEQIIEAMQDILVQAENELALLQNQSVTAVIDIAQSVIEHVMGEQSGHLQRALETSVQQAMEQFMPGHSHGFVLAVHPQDLSAFSRISELPEGAKIRANAEVAQGTCRMIAADQDILIDPKENIMEAVQHVRQRLLNHG